MVSVLFSPAVGLVCPKMLGIGIRLVGACPGGRGTALGDQDSEAGGITWADILLLLQSLLLLLIRAVVLVVLVKAPGEESWL